MTRYLLGIVSVVAFSGMTWAGPADMFEEKEKDFGVSPKGTTLIHYFRFTNNTKQTVTLGQPRVSCGCVTPALTTTKVAPGETAAVLAYMDTRRIPYSGVTKTVIVYVPFQSPTFEEVALKVTTVTRDDLLMSPDTLAFGTVSKGKPTKTTTKVTFTSDPNYREESVEHRDLCQTGIQTRIPRRHDCHLRSDRDDRQGLSGRELDFGYLPRNL